MSHYTAPYSVRKIALALLSLCVVLSTSCASLSALPPLPHVPIYQTKGDWVKVQITLAGPLPPAPGRAMVYRVSYPASDAARLSELARAFGLLAQPQAGPYSRMAVNGTRALELYAATGAFWFKDSSELWSGKKPAALPDEQAGIAMASEFLRANGLLPKGMLFENVGSSQLTVYDVATGQQSVYEADLHVNYRMQIGGVPVDGPGGRIKVYLGDGGRVIGVYWAVFEVVPYKEYPLITPSAALAEVEAQGIPSTVKSPRSATVTDIDLVYYAGPGLEPQEYLQPVYRFRGEIEGDSESAPYTRYVPAIASEYRKPEPPSAGENFRVR